MRCWTTVGPSRYLFLFSIFLFVGLMLSWVSKISCHRAFVDLKSFFVCISWVCLQKFYSWVFFWEIGTNKCHLLLPISTEEVILKKNCFQFLHRPTLTYQIFFCMCFINKCHFILFCLYLNFIYNSSNALHLTYEQITYCSSVIRRCVGGGAVSRRLGALYIMGFHRHYLEKR